jgi:hypothetical protein
MGDLLGDLWPIFAGLSLAANSGRIAPHLPQRRRKT